MKILFLTLGKITSLSDRGIYTDLLSEFVENGDEVYVVSPTERREKGKTTLITKDGYKALVVSTLNIQKTSLIEKGVSTLLIEYQYLSAIKKYFADVKFDLVLYSTPPITFFKVVKYIKKRDGAYSYLLLKDIFPQNAVDMGMLKKNGLLHKFFLKKERKLYNISDRIGCLSEANINFLRKHNPEINFDNVEVNPNTINPIKFNIAPEEKLEIRNKYGLPVNKKIFAYGGNLGVPQGLDFLLETIKHSVSENAFFLIVGTGTEFQRLKKWFDASLPSNALLLAGLPKKDFDTLLSACDVGLVFLHKNFTIPNFPSRLLSYLEMGLPVLSATDAATDVGTTVENARSGYSVLCGDLEMMLDKVNVLSNQSDEDYNIMRTNAWNLLNNEFHVHRSYKLIKNCVKNV